MKERAEEIDLPTFDLIFERFINFKWGKNLPKTYLSRALKIIEFLSIPIDMNITLTKE